MSEPYFCDWSSPCLWANLKKIQNEIDEMKSAIATVYHYCDREHEVSKDEYEEIEKIIKDLKKIAWID